jgi:hypothetical protein
MSQNLILGLPTPVALALLALILISAALTRVVFTLRRPAPVRLAHYYVEAPYKLEAPGALHAGKLEVVSHAGSEPANR